MQFHVHVCHANTPHTVLIEIIIENKNWDRRKPSVLSTIVYTEIRKTDRHFHSIVHCSHTCALVNMMQQDINEHSTSIHVQHNNIFWFIENFHFRLNEKQLLQKIHTIQSIGFQRIYRQSHCRRSTSVAWNAKDFAKCVVWKFLRLSMDRRFFLSSTSCTNDNWENTNIQSRHINSIHTTKQQIQICIQLQTNFIYWKICVCRLEDKSIDTIQIAMKRIGINGWHMLANTVVSWNSSQITKFSYLALLSISAVRPFIELLINGNTMRVAIVELNRNSKCIHVLSVDVSEWTETHTQSALSSFVYASKW